MQTLVAPSDVDHDALRDAARRIAGRSADDAMLVVIGAVAVAKHQQHGATVLSAEERAELATLAAATWLSADEFTSAAVSRAAQLLGRPGAWRTVLALARQG